MLSVVLYVLSRKVGDRTVRQLNLNSLFVYEAGWVDVHQSVVDPVAEDVQKLARFAATLRFEK